MSKPYTLLALALLLAGCQILPSPSYEELATRASEGELIEPARLKRAFLASESYDERMSQLAELERDALQLLEGQPLKLGALGSAILDLYYGSLAGHEALTRFYDHVEAPDAADKHEQWVEAITDTIEADSDGSQEAPYVVLSAAEAQAYLLSRGLVPVGSMYHSTEQTPFLMLTSARPESGPLQTFYFDLTTAFEAVRDSLDQEDPEHRFSPGVLIGYLAQQNDSAAQVSIGTFQASRQQLDEAVNWLTAAARSGNVLANLMLARVYGLKAEQLEGAARDEAMELMLDNYLHAIAIGSDDAMYTLGGLYINGEFGEENIPSGVALLRQAVEVENTNAMLLLAHMHMGGIHVAQDDDAAAGYLHRAGALGDDRARLDYARFLISRSESRPFDPEAYTWLEELAENGEPEALLLLGNLYAKGVHLDQSFRRALNQFKAAVSAAPEDAYIVNEVAWTLAVTHLEDLRNAGYAREIMDRVMTTDTEARNNPAYLDTWAATYAASGDFDRAIELQQQAVAEAEAREDDDVLPVLREHLESFRAGQAIIDPIP